jgi:hypothetical protein
LRKKMGLLLNLVLGCSIIYIRNQESGVRSQESGISFFEKLKKVRHVLGVLVHYIRGGFLSGVRKKE